MKIKNIYFVFFLIQFINILFVSCGDNHDDYQDRHSITQPPTTSSSAAKINYLTVNEVKERRTIFINVKSDQNLGNQIPPRSGTLYLDKLHPVA
ncbi:MAG: hypothetical protein HQK53_12000 [Oligoflexia bacterium]|nr:hypothetical protein [Oligoflexia bacterium]